MQYKYVIVSNLCKKAERLQSFRFFTPKTPPDTFPNALASLEGRRGYRLQYTVYSSKESKICHKMATSSPNPHAELETLGAVERNPGRRSLEPILVQVWILLFIL